MPNFSLRRDRSRQRRSSQRAAPIGAVVYPIGIEAMQSRSSGSHDLGKRGGTFHHAPFSDGASPGTQTAGTCPTQRPARSWGTRITVLGYS